MGLAPDAHASALEQLAPQDYALRGKAFSLVMCEDTLHNTIVQYLKIVFLQEVTNGSDRSCNKPTEEGLRFFTFCRGITRKRTAFTA